MLYLLFIQNIYIKIYHPWDKKFWRGHISLSNSENREHLKNFRNVDCVLANHKKVQDTQANLKTTNLLPLLFAV